MIASTTKIKETPPNHEFLPVSTNTKKIDNNINITALNITFTDFIKTSPLLSHTAECIFTTFLPHSLQPSPFPPWKWLPKY